VNGTALLTPVAVLTVVLLECRVAILLMWKLAVMVVELTTTTLLTVTPPFCTVTLAGEVKLVPEAVTLMTVPRLPEFGLSEVSVGGPDAVAAVTVND